VRVVVVHYDLDEAAALADRLRREGIDAEPYRFLGTRGFRHIRENPPAAVLIDLMRMPSYGRAMGGMLRETKSTRSIPLVFLEGDPEKTARVREALPDAIFAPLGRLAPALKRAVKTAPADPVVPARNVSVAYKLRVRAGDTVSLIGAPEGFESHLPGAAVRRSRDGEVVLLFVKSAAALGRELPRLATAPPRALWVLWPKRASRAAGDLSLPGIHDACAPLGLVAYKTCSVDDTWSAAAVSRRRSGHLPRPK
jgi:hypothetical protein